VRERKSSFKNKQDPTTQQQAATKNSAKSFAGSSPSSLTNHTPIQETQNGVKKKKTNTDKREC
jgi:hypothetical protein